MKRKTKKSIKTLPAKKVSPKKGAKVRGGSLSTMLTNLQQMKHEQLKGIAQNLRG